MSNDKVGATFNKPVEVQVPQPQAAVNHVANHEPLLPGNQRQGQHVKQSRDRAQYVRQQKGHSWVVWWLLLGPITLWIPAIYYSASPNHYWHA